MSTAELKKLKDQELEEKKVQAAIEEQKHKEEAAEHKLK
jgi:hypothetical protein